MLRTPEDFASLYADVAEQRVRAEANVAAALAARAAAADIARVAWGARIVNRSQPEG